MVIDPLDLLTWHQPPSSPGPAAPDGAGPVLLHTLAGFVDAGGAARLAMQHLLEHLGPQRVATFDVDLLFDYRARRPLMLLEADHWESYADPVLAVDRLHDLDGRPFLLLHGPEPDVMWERFCAAVAHLVTTEQVRLTVGLSAIALAVPHTRPVSATVHGTRPGLTADHEPWLESVQVPASAANLLELRLGGLGHDALGIAAHVPHYLGQGEFPGSAVVLLETVERATGLRLPIDGLRDQAAATRAALDEQVAGSEELTGVVRGLEQQWEAFQRAQGRPGLLDADLAQLPSGDELGSAFERYLAERADDGPPDAGTSA